MWLLVRSGPDEGAAVPVTGDAFVLGRQSGCDLVVRDARASRRHVELRPADGGNLLLCDLKSANGTLVDGRRVSEAVLEGGEEIRIGDVRMEVARGAPPGGARLPVATRGHGGAGAGSPPDASYSGIRRLVEQSTRRARRAAALGLLAAAIAVAAVLVLVTSPDEDPVPAVVSELAPATVLVMTERPGARGSTGSGWVLDAGAGLIVTNAHVVNEGETVRVVAGGSERAAEVHAVAPCEDLALLRIADRAGLPEAPVAPAGSVQVGETVVALGFAAGAEGGDGVGSTTGVVSRVGADLRRPAPDVPAYTDAILTDTALNPGNSGGPLADLEGRVIGVNSAARTTGAGDRPLQNVNYAIAMDRARTVLDTLRTGTGLAWTGLTFGYPTDGELAREGLPPGLRITGATEQPAAARIEPGSLLVAVQGRPVGNTLQSYCDVAAGLRGGDRVALDVVTPGATSARRVAVTLP